jgi:GT2 family glycosyltransferase
LERYLPVLKSNTGPEVELVVADNASTDGTESWIKEYHPELNFIQNGSNLGFAAGYNNCLAKVDAELFILLNSDVEVTKDWLPPLIQAMENDNRVGACQPKLLWEKQRDTFEYSGAAGGYIDFLGYPFCRGRIFGHLEKDNGQYDTPISVFWASGACMAIRKSVFEEVGGFDGQFFAHMEEIDLCWRIRNHGYDIQCIPASVVFHVGGATLPKNNSRKTFLNFRNNLSMLWKNLRGPQLIPIIFLRLILDGIAGIKFAFEGNLNDCIAVLKAHFAFYYKLLSFKLKRGKNSAKPHATIFPKSIVVQHYILGKSKFSDLKFNPSKQ